MIQTSLQFLDISDYSGNLKQAFEYFIAHRVAITQQELGTYKVDPNFFYMIQEYPTKDQVLWEAHKKYIDIQIILDGEELIEVSSENRMTLLGEYDDTKDFQGFEGKALVTLLMKKNDFVVFYPYDVHKPALKTAIGNSLVRKCLFKVVV